MDPSAFNQRSGCHRKRVSQQVMYWRRKQFDGRVVMMDKKMRSGEEFVRFAGGEKDVNGAGVYCDGIPLCGPTHIVKTVVIGGAQLC